MLLPGIAIGDDRFKANAVLRRDRDDDGVGMLVAQSRPVADVLADALPNTLLLAGVAGTLAVLTGAGPLVRRGEDRAEEFARDHWRHSTTDEVVRPGAA